MSECDRFPEQSIHRAICLGQIRTLEHCNFHRNRWGLPPLTEMSYSSGGMSSGSSDGRGDILPQLPHDHQRQSLSTAATIPQDGHALPRRDDVVLGDGTRLARSHAAAVDVTHIPAIARSSFMATPVSVAVDVTQRRLQPTGSQLQPISGQLPPPNPPDVVKSGPGTELRKLFEGWKKYIPIEQDHDLDQETAKEVAAVGAASCLGCQGLEAKMNALGPDACEKIVDEIAAKVKENARKHKVRRLGITVDRLPLFDFTIRRLINKAIEQSRKTM